MGILRQTDDASGQLCKAREMFVRLQQCECRAYSRGWGVLARHNLDQKSCNRPHARRLLLYEYTPLLHANIDHRRIRGWRRTHSNFLNELRRGRVIDLEKGDLTLTLKHYRST